MFTSEKFVNEDFLKKHGISLLCGSELPQRLRGVQCLFVQGNVELLKEDEYFFLAIVGSRDPQGDCESLIRKTVEVFAACTNLVVVSGLARGIDSAAHSIALELGVPTISVLGYGILHAYSTRKEYRQLRERIPQSGGLVVSQYEPYEPPGRSNFLTRNELIVRFSDLIFPVQGKVPSGTYSTVVKAVKMRKPIFCLRNRWVKDIIRYLRFIRYNYARVLAPEELDLDAVQELVTTKN